MNYIQVTIRFEGDRYWTLKRLKITSLSSVVPMIYSAAGKSKIMSPGVAIAAVSTIGYLGFLFGPPLIGFIAQATSLRISFGMIAMMGAMIAIISTRVKF